MKRIVSISTALVMLILAFAGCGNSFTLEKGEWNGNTFTNEVTGVKLTIDDNWVAATDEELAEMMDLTIDEVTDGDSNSLSDAVLKLQNIFDCMVTNNSTGSSVIVLYENLTVSGSSKMTAEEYLNTLKEQLPSSLGTAFEIGEVSERTVGSNTYKTLCADASDSGVVQYYLTRKIDNYMINIIVTAVGQEPDEVFALIG